MTWAYMRVSVRRHTWPKVFQALKAAKCPVHDVRRENGLVTFRTTTKGLELLQSEHPSAVVKHHAERLDT